MNDRRFGSPRLLVPIVARCLLALSAATMACSTEATSTASDAAQAATSTDAADGLPIAADADAADASGTASDSQPETVADPCATANGGCGDPDSFACTAQAGVAVCSYDPTADRKALVAGVGALAYGGGLSSTLVLHGDTAFGIAADSNGEPVVAAGRYGKGKWLFVGHEGQLAGSDGSGKLLGNALTWMAAGQTKPSVGVAAGLDAASKFVAAQSFATTAAQLPKPGEMAVWIGSAHTQWKDAEIETIRSFVAQGGAIILGGHAWYWGSTHAHVATEFAANRLLRPMGMVITAAAAATPGGNVAVPATPLSPLVHSLAARDAVVAHAQGGKQVTAKADQKLIGTIVGRAIEVLPLDWPWYVPALVLLDKAATTEITAKNPFDKANKPIEAIAVYLRVKLALEQTAALMKADPADFPGDVPKGTAQNGPVTLTVDGNHAGLDGRFGYADAKDPGWRSTGVYVPPGGAVTVTVPATLAAKNLQVQIGCHTDNLYGLDKWTRMPAIVRTETITSAETQVASGFGGLVYVLVPVGAQLGPIQVGVAGGVAAPRFVLGQTTVADWLATIRQFPAPWAELESARVILTVPSDAIRKLDDPTAVLQKWDAILDADADLAGLPHDRPRKERIVLDRQISAGSLHSGYPIMGHLDSAAELTDIAVLKGGAWGPLHELGHNHQWVPWVLPGTTESSVNLWSVYASEQVLGIPRAKAHPALDPAARQQRILDHVAKGAPMSNWSVWTALETYLQLQEKFGWAPLTAVMTEYRGIAPADDPKDDAARIEQWIVRSSKAVKMDLTAFYAAWGLPVSPAAKAAVAGLPPWLDHPLAK